MVISGGATILLYLLSILPSLIYSKDKATVRYSVDKPLLLELVLLYNLIG